MGKINKTTVLNGALAFVAGMALWTLAKPQVDKISSKLTG